MRLDFIMHYDESNWVKGLRIIAWINLISGVIGGFVLAREVGEMFAVRGQEMNWLFFSLP